MVLKPESLELGAKLLLFSQISSPPIKFNLSWKFMSRCSFLVLLPLQKLYALSAPHLSTGITARTRAFNIQFSGARADPADPRQN